MPSAIVSRTAFLLVFMSEFPFGVLGAQLPEVGRDTIPLTLPVMRVISHQPEARRSFYAAFAHRNPFLELHLRDSRVTTTVPGIGGNVFVDVPGGAQIYSNNTNFLLNLQPNAGLLSGFARNNLEMRRVERSALRPALDEPIEFRMRPNEGFFIGIQPLEFSTSVGHTSVDSGFAFGFSADRHSVPGWIPKRTRREMAVLGGGERIHGFWERRSVGGPRVFLEGYFLRHVTDAEQILGFSRYRDWITQYYGTLGMTIPSGRGNDFRLTLNNQHGETALSVWGDSAGLSVLDTAQKRFQNLTFRRAEAALVGARGQFGVAAYRLTRNSTIGGAKQFGGLQIFGSRQHLFSSSILRNFLFYTDARADAVRGRPHLSAYISLMKEAYPSVTFTLAAGSVWDATNAETLRDNLADFSPVIPIAGQRVRYGLFRTSYARGSRTLWFSFDTRSATAQQFFPGALIRGESYRLGYDLSFRRSPRGRISFSTTAVFRKLNLYTGEATTLVPGSPSAELKASFSYARSRHAIMVSGTMLSNFPYPKNRGQLAVNLGGHNILSFYYSLEASRTLRFSMSAINILRHFGEQNFIAAHGDQRLAMPMVLYASVEIAPSFRGSR